MRDNNVTKEYFEERIQETNILSKRSLEWINNGEVAKERIPIVYKGISRDYLSLFWAKYSAGYAIEDLKEDFRQSLYYMYISWMEMEQRAFKKNIYLNHYFEGEYLEMLNMLSIAAMLNEGESTFETLSKIIDKDNVKDLVFEFILSNKLKNRKMITESEETYTEIQRIPKIYQNLRNAILEKDKTKSSKYLKQFLMKDFVKYMNKEVDTQRSIEKGLYSGVWNMESGAISFLLDIDVCEFEDFYLFPKDLYYYAKSKKV